MPSLPPASQIRSSSSRPTSHFRVQTSDSSPRPAASAANNSAGSPAGPQTTAEADAATLALQDTTALLDQFALTTLSRAARASAPSTLNVKLALIETLAQPRQDVNNEHVETAGRSELVRKALRVLDPSDWDDLVDERWADHLCGFAACSEPGPSSSRSNQPKNPPPREAYVPREERAAGRPSRLQNVRLRGGNLVQKSLASKPTSGAAANADDGSNAGGAIPPGAYCSEGCRVRSEYYRSLAGRGREPEPEEMWDEMERRRERVRQSTEQLAATAPATGSTSSTAVAEPAPSSRSPPPSLPTAAPPVPAPAPSAFITDLSIHEKPLPQAGSTRPAPPTLADADRDLERPIPPRKWNTTAAGRAVASASSPSGSPAANGSPERPPETARAGSSSLVADAAGDPARGALPPIRFLTPPREVRATPPPSTQRSGSRNGPGADGEVDEFAHGPVLEGIGEEEMGWLEAALREREACEGGR